MCSAVSSFTTITQNLVTGAGVKGIGSYLWARFARLYPLFLLMMLVYVLISSRHFDYWTGHAERLNSTFRALPYFLFSVQSWFYVVIDGNPLLDAIGGASPITWSISTEWFFYFLYLAFVWLVLKSRTPPVTFLIILLWCLVWTAIAAGLYNRSDRINAWAVAQFGPVADAANGRRTVLFGGCFTFRLTFVSENLSSAACGPALRAAPHRSGER